MDAEIESVIGFLNDSNIKPLIKPPRVPVSAAENSRGRPKSLVKTPVHPILEGLFSR